MQLIVFAVFQTPCQSKQFSDAENRIPSQRTGFHPRESILLGGGAERDD